MHEFEALLFSDPNILAKKTGFYLPKIKRIVEQYNNPEEINDSPTDLRQKDLKLYCPAIEKLLWER